MSDRPADLPRWADLANADDIIEPTSGRKDAGWNSAQRPPSQYENWLLNAIYLWLLWIKNGVWQRSSLTDNTPVMSTSDRDGRQRHLIGPEGYIMGPVIQDMYRWSPINDATDAQTGIGTASVASLVTTDNGANTATRILGPTSSAPATGGPRLRLRILDAATSSKVMTYSDTDAGTNKGPVGNLDDVVAIMEWRAYVTSIGADEVQQFMGLHSFNNTTISGIQDGTVSEFVMFRRNGSTPDTNWFCVFGDNVASGTPVDSGVAVAADTWYTFRIELHGANTPVGVGNSTAAVARYFIDGAEVAEVTAANLPAGASTMGHILWHAADATGPTGDVDLVAGPVRLAWNEVLDADVPA